MNAVIGSRCYLLVLFAIGACGTQPRATAPAPAAAASTAACASDADCAGGQRCVCRGVGDQPCPEHDRSAQCEGEKCGGRVCRAGNEPPPP